MNLPLDRSSPYYPFKNFTVKLIRSSSTKIRAAFWLRRRGVDFSLVYICINIIKLNVNVGVVSPNPLHKAGSNRILT